jgi:hypothetical protein
VYVELWEVPSNEALYLLLRGADRSYVTYAHDGGLFLADAARMAADPKHRPSQGHSWAEQGLPDMEPAGARLVAVWMAGRLQFQFPLGALRFGTLRYLGFTFPAQQVSLDQAGEAALAWQRGRAWQAEQWAREATRRDFDAFWNHEGPNWTDDSGLGFYRNFTMDERGRMADTCGSVWMAARGFRL